MFVCENWLEICLYKHWGTCQSDSPTCVKLINQWLQCSQILTWHWLSASWKLLSVNVSSSAHAHIMQDVTVFLVLFMWGTQTVHAQGQWTYRYWILKWCGFVREYHSARAHNCGVLTTELPVCRNFNSRQPRALSHSIHGQHRLLKYKKSKWSNNQLHCTIS